MKKESEEDKIKREVRLVEYQKAQDSAEHHNNLVWTLTNLGIGLSLIILYVSWTDKSIDSYIKEGLLFIGCLIFMYFSSIIENSNKKKNEKYKLCQDIEKEYPFIGQHSLTVNLFNKGNLFLFRWIKIIILVIYLISVTFIPFLFNSQIFLGIPLIGVVLVSSTIIYEILLWKVNSFPQQ
jgi:hypothetical protein